MYNALNSKKIMTRTLVCTDIDDIFCYAQYLDLTVIMHKLTGFINSSNLCRRMGKEAEDWVRGNSILNGYKKFLEMEGQNQMTSFIMRGNPELAGMYIHPDLAIDLAVWISDEEMGFKMHRLVQQYVLQKQRLEDLGLVKEACRVMDLANNQATDLSNRIKKIEKEISDLCQLLKVADII